MKRYMSILLAAALCLTLAACGKPADDGNTEIPNPMTEAASAAELKEKLGVTLDAPEGAENVTYYTISDTIAHVAFTLDGVEYTARGAAASYEGDISGANYDWEDEQLGIELDTAGLGLSITVKTAVGEGCRLASWSVGEYNYTLFTAEAVSDEVITGVATAVGEITAK